MGLVDKDYIDASRRAMNLLTKRGSWKPAPINPKNPRLVTYYSGSFEIVGQQVGGSIKFDIIYDGRVCVQGNARVNWLTEDDSFEFIKTEISEQTIEDLKKVYLSDLQESTIK